MTIYPARVDREIPGVGHNQPPDPLLEEARERIDAANRWLTERSDLDTWDAAIADKATFFVKQLATTLNDLDGRRLTENRAFDAAQDAKYGKTGDLKKGRPGIGLLGLLAQAEYDVNNLVTGWLQRKEKLLEAERAAKALEAKRLADEAEKVIARAQEQMAKKGGDPLRAMQEARQAEERAAAAREEAERAPVKAQIKGTYTSTAKSLRDVWGAEIEDVNLAFRHYNKKGHPSKLLLEAAIRDCIRVIAIRESQLVKDLTKSPPGIKFTKERK